MTSENESEKRETLADIVAQMRGRGEDGRMDRRLWLDYADRIDAAWRREKAEAEADALAVGGVVEAERHKPGNAAAMREALLRCEAISCLPEIREQQSVRDMRNIIAAALSAPPRNCDVGTAEEQNRRFDNFCRGEDCKTCPCNVMPRCHMIWAQMPYAAEV